MCNFEINLNKPLVNYNNIFTLNLKTQSLTEGKLLSRSFLLVSMRLILTLAIEAAIFWIYGFRGKKSWTVFLTINLITQGALNIWINSFSPSQSYIIFSLIFGELFIFIAEITAFLTFCKQYGRLRKVLYVLTANFISLLAGGYISGVLPTKLKFIEADNEIIIDRFYKACIGWIRYKPLLLYITQRDSYDETIKDMRKKLEYTLPKICEYFQQPEFINILGELDKYHKNAERHFCKFKETQLIWEKIMNHFA